jgi:hypothetical protein
VQPSTDRDAATREKLRSDTAAPRHEKSKTDRENKEPILAIPKTEIEEPTRENARSDNDAPMSLLSSTAKVEHKRAMPKRENEDPKRR